ncbi:uncharacterized protein LOC113533584 isoform X2 [Pangasianodon hypophthalmus]|uniref:uncharacterized protein LOC113533584 isoform X2 n=1 Tax=Pangasianodon hypophthalmus TaxID=310915 RepID=UPI002306EEAE|nr:uncharacterized protein LOC113533584 isoform X2 [Pangasianodon hypophthalmus]
MQMEQHDRETRTIEERNTQSTDLLKVNIVAQGGNVFAPIFHNVQGAGCITLTQSIAGTNLSEGATRDVTSVMAEYKESILSMYEYTREYTSRPGEHVLLADRYVDPLIIQRHRVKKEREKEMRSKGNDFFNLRTYDVNQSIGTDNLFSQEDGPNNECPKAVILQGNSGNGKSFMAQKIILDWAKGDLFAGIFDVVFHLRCSELNGISGDISLVELLNCSEEMTQILNDKEKRVLFLVDGFDELRRSLPEKALPVRVDIQAKPGAILSSLLRGIMLKDSFLLVTTRSTSTEKLGKLLKCPQRFTEIMGFSEKGVQEYFQKFFEDKDLSKQVHEQVKIHEALYTACFSPVMCWLICNVFKQKHNIGTRMTSGLKSTTSIFIDFVFTLLEHHCQDLNQSQQFILLKNLGQLAEEGMLKGKILFERHFVPEVILNMVGLPFLCTFHHREGTRMKEMFSFMHLSFQEFFAALFYILIDKAEAETKIKQLLSSVSDLFQISQNSHLLPVIQFLFGLSNKKVTNLINEKHVVSREIGSLLEKWMHTFVKNDMMANFSSFTLHCLYEVNDRNVVMNVMKIWETGRAGVKILLSSSQMTDYRAAAYCLQFCRRIRSLYLRASTMQTLKMMETALSKCYELHLTVNFVSDDDVGYLISAMGKGKELQYLRIEDGNLSDHSVQMIMSTLPKQRSVGDVHLTVKAINHSNTEILMNFHKSQKASGKLSLKAATLTNKEESLCSNFVIENYNLYRITIEHKDVDSAVKCGLALVCLSVAFDSVIANSDLKHLLWISYNLKEIESPQFEEHVDALLSFLRSTPGSTTVMLNAKNLSLKGAAKILAFSQNRPSVGRDSIWFVVDSLKNINEEDICSLSLSTDDLVYVDGVMQHLKLKVHSPSLQDAHEIHESKPILLQLSLTFPPVEGATVSWEVLFKMNSQLMKSNQSTCFSFDKQMKTLFSVLQSVPSLMEVKLHLRSLPENWAAEVIYFLQACSSLPFFELRVGSGGETLGMIRGVALRSSDKNSILSFGCRHLDYHDYHGWISATGYITDDVHRVLPCITLTITNHTDFYNDSWTTFFHHYNQLKTMTELYPEYDQSMDELLSVMNTIPGLKEVELAFTFLTVHGASSILHLIQTSSSLCKIDVILARQRRRDLAEEQNVREDWKSFQGDYEGDSVDSDISDSNRSAKFSSGSYDTDVEDYGDTVYLPRQLSSDSEIENYDLDLCSELRIRKNTRNECKLSLRCNGSNPDTKAVFAYISLIVSEYSGEPEINWRSFFQSYYETKGLIERNPYFAEKTNALLSFLHIVPGLEEVEFGIHSLTESWAPRILFLCHANRNIHSIRLLLENDKQIEKDSACSSLTIKRNFTDSTVTVKIHVLSNTTILSLIYLKLPCSEISNLDGAGLLYRLRCLEGLNDISQEYNVQINELISFLHSVPQLQKLKFQIENLTTTWATRVLSFKTCQSLTKIFVITSSYDMLMEEAISELKKNWTCQDCVLVITGLRCSNPTDKCSKQNWLQECNKNVKLSFCGGHYSEEPIMYGQCETDSERDENKYYRFECYSDVAEEDEYEEEDGDEFID